MRHGKKINHLGRKSAHRHALLSNMASSLILHKRITTTVAKAKALKKYVEPLITKAKDNSTHSRRTVMSYLQNKESVTALFGEVAGRTADRPGVSDSTIPIRQIRSHRPSLIRKNCAASRPVNPPGSVTSKPSTIIWLRPGRS
jgi:large subunit ribosomal protein L17